MVEPNEHSQAGRQQKRPEKVGHEDALADGRDTHREGFADGRDLEHHGEPDRNDDQRADQGGPEDAQEVRNADVPPPATVLPEKTENRQLDRQEEEQEERILLHQPAPAELHVVGHQKREQQRGRERTDVSQDDQGFANGQEQTGSLGGGTGRPAVMVFRRRISLWLRHISPASLECSSRSARLLTSIADGPRATMPVSSARERDGLSAAALCGLRDSCHTRTACVVIRTFAEVLPNPLCPLVVRPVLRAVRTVPEACLPTWGKSRPERSCRPGFASVRR